MADAKLSSGKTEIFQLTDEFVDSLFISTAFCQRFQLALFAGGTNDTDAEKSDGGSHSFIDASVLRKIMHGLQREKQARVFKIVLCFLTDCVKGEPFLIQFDQFFHQETKLRAGRQRVKHMNLYFRMC